MKMLGRRIVRKNAEGPFSLGQGAGARGGPRRRRTMVTMPMMPLMPMEASAVGSPKALYLLRGA